MDTSEDQVLNYTEAPPTRKTSRMFDSSHERKQKVRVRASSQPRTRARERLQRATTGNLITKKTKTEKLQKLQTPELNSEKLEMRRKKGSEDQPESPIIQASENRSAKRRVQPARPASSAAHAGARRLETLIQSCLSHQSLSKRAAWRAHGSPPRAGGGAGEGGL